MANVDSPNGFIYLRGGDPMQRFSGVFYKLAGVGTAIFPWDVVHFVAGTSLSGDKGAVQPFGTATPGTTIPGGVAQDYGAASARTRHHVIIDQDAEYHAQDNGDTDGVGYADLNLNANVEANAGQLVGGTQPVSGHEIDESTINSSASRDLRLLGRYQYPVGNDIGTSHLRTICKFNTQRYGSGTVVGV